MQPFETGTLWDRATQATKGALAAGVLFPFSTEINYVEDAGVEFLVRNIRHLAVKKGQASVPGDARSPFLTPDPALFVADVSNTHLCLLNKFPVFEHHLLIVTREFEDQDNALNIDDFKALWRCMAEFDSLGFYNGGTLAGASQRHKHLQAVPLPLGPRQPGIPIEPLLDLTTITGDTGRSAALPIPHALAVLPPEIVHSESAAAELTHALYYSMLRQIGLVPEVTPLEAHNLLVTRNWMLIVPRVREKFESISLNALAFAGHFLVRTETELNLLRQCGPIRALRHVTSIAL